MFTAASVMNRVCGWPGTSMTKTWLMRRPVRSPVSRFITSDSSSSVCRLPFMRRSALPVRTSSTAFSAAAWLCGTSTISMLPRSSENCLATAAILSLGPTRIGLISPASPASTAPLSEVSSQGCATAVAIGCRLFAAAIRRSYFSCRRKVDAVEFSFMARSFSSDCANGADAASLPAAPGEQAARDLSSAHRSWELWRPSSTRTSRSSRRAGSCRACFPRRGPRSACAGCFPCAGQGQGPRRAWPEWLRPRGAHRAEA